MKFYAAMHYLKNGKAVRRKGWSSSTPSIVSGSLDDQYSNVSLKDTMEDDWYLVGNQKFPAVLQYTSDVLRISRVRFSNLAEAIAHYNNKKQSYIKPIALIDTETLTFIKEDSSTENKDENVKDIKEPKRA